ncbi:MAG: efflux RND transporter periplasmic adaptor subunit, partial [Pedobacter sp.]
MKRVKNVIFAFFLVSLIIGAIGCSGEKKTTDKTADETKQTYTCPMHPQVVKHEMGTCPICAMDLVPFEKNSDDKSIKLDAQRQLLANIATIRIGDATNVQTQSVLNGRLVVNPEQSNYISAKIAGRVEQLYVRETGV